MVTFAGLVMLLMVFFILVFVMGSIEDEKWKQMKASLKSALGQEIISEAGIREGLDVIKFLDIFQSILSYIVQPINQVLLRQIFAI